MSVTPPSPGASPSRGADRSPVWAHDGRRFAVVRVTTSASADANECRSAAPCSDHTGALSLTNLIDG
ncbi:MAG: hypothetical protein K6T87_20280 [Roseiflexus sp.]|uniref:hypothetical protein n=1 Tax=Roseiflexus sp. TaxID=2562120 RepID=UPI0025F3D53C|nr:hypothetical protein [Roseiflexus sp.]MCL6542896.1 hypothetical protein [Roseiflexus sp.]